MLDPPSDNSICICTNCMELHFDRQKVDELTNDVLEDLNTLYEELQKDMEKCDDPETRDLKFQKLLVKLEAIENAVVYIHNDLKNENDLRENLDSNFGISVQIETLEEDLENQKKMHDKLRIEWYSQEEHLSRLVEKVHIQDTALDNQSIYCTTQGFTLSKMLWKISNRNDLLDKILVNEKFTEGIFQTFKNCLEAFTLTYRDKMPKPTSPEYQYVLSLAGAISNISAVPDGRFFIINHIIGEAVLNDIIKSLPKVRAPSAESLKWIMLTIIHNMLVCKEGEELAKRNQLLLSNLAKCTTKPNSERISILALRILASLTTGVYDEAYMDHIMKSVPVKELRKLKKSATSAKVSKHASCVLSSVMKINKNYGNMENEKLIRTTQLNDSRSSCKVRSKPSRRSTSFKGNSCSCKTKNISDKSPTLKLSGRRSSCGVKSKPSKPSTSSKRNACCCCERNSTLNETKAAPLNAKKSSCGGNSRPSKPSMSSKGNTCCCCVVNKITRNISFESMSDSSLTDIGEPNCNYNSSIFSKHPTQSSVTIFSADENFKSESSSICVCSSSVVDTTRTLFEDNKTRHKLKQFHTAAADDVACKSAKLNLTARLKSPSSESSSMEDVSLRKEISLNLDFDPIRVQTESAVDEEAGEVFENQSTKCIQCSCEEFADTLTGDDEDVQEGIESSPTKNIQCSCDELEDVPIDVDEEVQQLVKSELAKCIQCSCREFADAPVVAGEAVEHQTPDDVATDDKDDNHD